MKKFTLGIIVGLLIGLLTFASFAVADSPIKLIVNGTEVQTGDCPPQIVNGYTLVPARALAEALGADVTWDNINNAVTIVSRQTPAVATTQTNITQAMPKTVTKSSTMTVNNGNITASTTPVTTVNADGSKTTVNPDGSKTTVTPDGVTTTVKADGSSSYSGTYRATQTDGGIMLTPDPSGDVKASGGSGSGANSAITHHVVGQ